MSLINEALKRTNEAQQQNPPPSGGPAFRPAEPATQKGGSGARTLLFIMVAAVVVGNFLLWIAFSDHNARKVKAAANTQLSTTPNPNPTPAPQPAPAPAVIPVVPEPTPAPAVTPSEMADVAPAVEDITPEAISTNAPEPTAGVVFAEPPKPTVLRLQSIIYSSTRPSAMIGGKFLFIGDRIQGHQVIAIDKETVTLVGEGQTNVLSLP